MLQSYPTMTDIVDRLEDARLVVRERSTPKTAARCRQPDPLGQSLLARARNARLERMTHALAHFSASDRRAFVRLLTAYLKALEEELE